MKLSVTTTNYNHGAYIARALESVVTQSNPPDQFIIIDDGSTDNSVEIIESYCKRYPYIEFHAHKHNQGFFASIDEARQRVNGDYLYSFSADDFIYPNFFKNAMMLARKFPHAGLITGKMISIDARGIELGVVEVPNWKERLYATPERFLNEYLSTASPGHTMGSATIYRRDILKSMGDFRVELGPLCDHFVIRAIGLKYGVCYIPEPCAAWSMVWDSLSQQSFRQKDQMLAMLKKEADLMQSDEFRSIFPPDFVVKWESEFRHFIERYSNPLIQWGIHFGMRCLPFFPFKSWIPGISKIIRKALT